ncbi:WD40 repeat domain-containing protein [Streptomyces sp. NPDC053048]|uniref:WD40 repeat domain-containing protein n=1 Tax=Streptomyces sp. NPDC053048 TaxID=3365694 RepID=UPI0037CD0DB4
MAYSLDGRTLATAGADGTVRLWDTKTHRPIATLTGHTKGVTGVVFSPDGRTVATTSADRTIRLWSAATNRTTTVVAARTTDGSPVFSPDGRTLATASTDNATRLWDLDPDKVATEVCALDRKHRWTQLIPDLPRSKPCGS